MKLNILFIDNNSFFVKNAINHLKHQLALGSVENIKDVSKIVEHIGKTNLDLVFIDLSLLKNSGNPNFCREVKNKQPKIKLIGLSLFDNEIICRSKKYNCIDYCIDKGNFYNGSLYLIKALFA